MIVLLVSVLVGVLVLGRCLRRAPWLTLTVIAVVGFGLHARIIVLPAAITRPAAHIAHDVRAWQQRQSDSLSCLVSQASAARHMDDASLNRAEQLCTTTTTAP